MNVAAPEVLVTGGAGFVGSRFIHALAASGGRAVCVSRSDGPKPSLADVPEEALRVLQVPEYSRESLAGALDGLEFDCVVNFAATGVRPGDHDATALLDGNAGVLANLIDALDGRDVEAIMHVGSCAQYGPVSAGEPLAEDSPQRPLSTYGAAKLAAEAMGRAKAHSAGMRFVTLRLFHVFGIGEQRSRLVPSLIRALRAGEPVDLTGGDQVRDVTYADDVADAILAACKQAASLDLDAYNVCSSTPVTVRRIAESVARLTGRPLDLLRLGAIPYRSDEPMWLVGDGSAFESATSWKPRRSLEEGLRLMVEAAERAHPGVEAVERSGESDV